MAFCVDMIAKSSIHLTPPLRNHRQNVPVKTVAIDTPGGNLSLKIKSRAQQITLKPNIIIINNNKFFTFIMFGFKVICWALLSIFVPVKLR
jgi:hypothetical protein